MNTHILPRKKTKIVCTIGPASNSRETLQALMEAGMNIVRINFAHGDFASHRAALANVRAAADACGRNVTVMGDLPGPKMRIGELADESVELVRGETFDLYAKEIVGDKTKAYINLPKLLEVVVPGDRIYINDGMVQLTVRQVDNDCLHTEVRAGGELRSHKGVNFPGIDLGISAFTDRDHEFLQFAAEQQLDAVSQSFVQDAHDIQAVRDAAQAMDYHPVIIAKLERASAVDNLEEILDIADGIMVARGDLGVEVPIEQMAIIQKDMIFQANLAGKPVITATHMLESMTIHRRPTRAEASDVANAILDGTDCVMLSGETAVGKYPVESVSIMADIAQYTEENRPENIITTLLSLRMDDVDIDQRDLIAFSTYVTAEKLNTAVVFTPTVSGESAQRVARFRLPVWIVATTPFRSTAQRLQFTYGVLPEYLAERPTSWRSYVRDWVKDYNIQGDLALISRGNSDHSRLGSNLLEIIDLDQPDLQELW